MSIPMNPAEVPQASDGDLQLGLPLAVMFGAHPTPGTLEAVNAEIARRAAEGDLFFLCPQLCPASLVDSDGAGNLG
jgi:hypothetical protein